MAKTPSRIASSRSTVGAATTRVAGGAGQSASISSLRRRSPFVELPDDWARNGRLCKLFRIGRWRRRRPSIQTRRGPEMRAISETLPLHTMDYTMVSFFTLAFHSDACFGQRSFPSAGLWVHAKQMGASHVPLGRSLTFQSQSRFAGRSHEMQRRRFCRPVQTKPRAPFPKSTGWQGIVNAARPSNRRSMTRRLPCWGSRRGQR